MPGTPTPSPMQIIRDAQANAHSVADREKRYRRLLQIATFFDNQSDQLVREAVELVNADGLTEFRAELADDPEKLAAFDTCVALINSIRTLATQLSGVELPAMQNDPPTDPTPDP